MKLESRDNQSEGGNKVLGGQGLKDYFLKMATDKYWRTGTR